jgi:hypothetical protein
LDIVSSKLDELKEYILMSYRKIDRMRAEIWEKIDSKSRKNLDMLNSAEKRLDGSMWLIYEKVEKLGEEVNNLNKMLELINNFENGKMEILAAIMENYNTTNESILTLNINLLKN